MPLKRLRGMGQTARRSRSCSVTCLLRIPLCRRLTAVPEPDRVLPISPVRRPLKSRQSHRAPVQDVDALPECRQAGSGTMHGMRLPRRKAQSDRLPPRAPGHDFPDICPFSAPCRRSSLNHESRNLCAFRDYMRIVPGGAMPYQYVREAGAENVGIRNACQVRCVSAIRAQVSGRGESSGESSRGPTAGPGSLTSPSPSTRVGRPVPLASDHSWNVRLGVPPILSVSATLNATFARPAAFQSAGSILQALPAGILTCVLNATDGLSSPAWT